MRCSPTRWGCCVARRGSLEGGTVQLCDRFHPLLATFLLCIYSLSPPSLPSLPHRLCTNSGPFLFFCRKSTCSARTSRLVRLSVFPKALSAGPRIHPFHDNSAWQSQSLGIGYT